MPNAAITPKRQRISLRPEDRKRQLLETAKQVFLERGYDGTRVSDIVQAASVAQGTFYLYFDSKESAFLALTEATTQAQLGRLARIVEQEEEIGVTIDRCVRSSFEHGYAERELLRLINTTPLRAQVQNQTSSLNAAVLKVTAARIAREQRLRTIDSSLDPTMTAVMLSGALDWATYSFAVYAEKAPGRATIARAAAVLRNALQPPTSPPKPR